MSEQMQGAGPAQVQTTPAPAAQGPGGYHYAGFWIRFLAIFIDGIILNIVGGILGRLLGPGIGGFLSLCINIAYFIYFIGSSGQTPGKMVCGIKVINADGSSLDYQKAFLRWLGYIVSTLTLLIGYIIAGFDDEKRALHDRIFETRVIYIK
jgi:uncharacterized RDD family membrane protein YckC